MNTKATNTNNPKLETRNPKLKEAHAIAVLTEWDEFKDYDWNSIHSHVLKPAFLFDGRNILDHDALHQKGFKVYPIGKEKME